MNIKVEATLQINDIIELNTDDNAFVTMPSFLNLSGTLRLSSKGLKLDLYNLWKNVKLQRIVVEYKNEVCTFFYRFIDDTSLAFKVGEWCNCYFEDFGTLRSISVLTKNIESNITKEGGKLTIGFLTDSLPSNCDPIVICVSVWPIDSEIKS